MSIFISYKMKVSKWCKTCILKYGKGDLFWHISIPCFFPVLDTYQWKVCLPNCHKSSISQLLKILTCIIHVLFWQILEMCDIVGKLQKALELQKNCDVTLKLQSGNRFRCYSLILKLSGEFFLYKTWRRV